MNTQQPQPIQGPVVNANRSVNNSPERPWSNGLFGCFGALGTCCVAWWCPCITFGRNKRRLEHLNTQGTPDPENGGCCNSDCMIHALLLSCGVGCLLQFMLRGNVRQRYNIKGGSCGDCCAAFLCTPCELTQESREIELDEDRYRGGGAGKGY